EMATGARPAAEAVGTGRFAQQRLRKAKRERVLADPARPVDEKRVWPARALRESFAHRSELPWIRRVPRQRGDGRRFVAFVGHQRTIAARCAAISPRTTTTGRVPSITRKRCGSAAARARYASRTRVKKPSASRS